MQSLNEIGMSVLCAHDVFQHYALHATASLLSHHDYFKDDMPAYVTGRVYILLFNHTEAMNHTPVYIKHIRYIVINNG